MGCQRGSVTSIDVGPGERAGDEEQAAIAEVDVLLHAALVDAQHAVGPADCRVDVGEEALGAAVGHLARAIKDVALEQRAQARPMRGQRALPVDAQQRDDLGQARGRVRDEGLEDGRQRGLAAIAALRPRPAPARAASPPRRRARPRARPAGCRAAARRSRACRRRSGPGRAGARGRGRRSARAPRPATAGAARPPRGRPAVAGCARPRPAARWRSARGPARRGRSAA